MQKRQERIDRYSATITELNQPVDNTKSRSNLERFKIYELCLEKCNLRVQVCNVGASITKLLFEENDCVLGYESPFELFESGNPFYMNAIVGRVANRIAGGSFQLQQKWDNEEGEACVTTCSYKLDTNNGTNHLHGGDNGFCHRLWDSQIKTLEDDDNRKGVRFTLISEDGDQGYPGSVKVTATYSMRPSFNGGAVLELEMCAQLLPCCENNVEKKATPINLSQHSYFNLACHNSPNGILDHVLRMPHAVAYTPTDMTSIPTREVKSLDEDSCMDFRNGKNLGEALNKFGVEKVGLSKEQAKINIAKQEFLVGEKPYGFDHNYVLAGDENATNDDAGETLSEIKTSNLRIAGILEHPPTKRRMTVYTNAPGVQVYTSNYLSNNDPSSNIDESCEKSSFPTKSLYRPWQGICLEPQHYPDSIISMEEEQNEDKVLMQEEDLFDFKRGRCVILRPSTSEKYIHKVEYHFDKMC